MKASSHAPPASSSSRVFAFVASACALGILASAWLIKQELDAERGAGFSGERLAQLAASHGTVKRRPSGSFAWSSAGDEQSFSRRDAVRTGSGASATLRLARDGSTIELGENSLFVVDEASDLRLSFVRGSALWRRPQGDAQIEAGSDGKARIREFKLSLVSPVSSLHVPAGQKLSVEFAWSGAADVPATTLQVSTSPRFSPGKTQSIALAATDSKAIMELAPGTYHWRVLGNDAPAGLSPLSATSRFEVAAVAAPAPIWPVEGVEVGVLRSDPRVSFRVAAQKAAAEEAWLEVARDAAFSQMVSQERLEGRAAEAIVALKDVSGRLYWRTRAVTADVRAVSAVESFVPQARDVAELEVVAPGAGQTVSGRNPVAIGWKPTVLLSSGTRYRVRIEPGAIELDAGEASRAAWRSSLEGSFKAQVVAYVDGRETARSAWREFRVASDEPVKLVSPAPGAEAYSWETGASRRPPTFSWRAVDASDYRVEWARDAAFGRERVEREVRATGGGDVVSLAFGDASYPALAEGTWYWRVSVGAGKRTSEARSFSWGAPPPLAAPAQLSPAAEAKIDPLSSEISSARIEWAAVEEARAYEVTIDGKTQRVRETSVPLPERGLGRFEWSVRAIDRLDRPGTASPSRGIVIEAPPLQAPRSKTREVQ